MGLKAEIWGWRLGEGGTKKEEKEKIPHLCESIGHRPLQGRCPKTMYQACCFSIRFCNIEQREPARLCPET